MVAECLAKRKARRGCLELGTVAHRWRRPGQHANRVWVTLSAMKLLFARHGQSVANAGGPSDDDSPLTATGQLQARRLAGHLGRKFAGRVAALYCSPFLRTLQTTAPIARALGIVPRVVVALHEMYGIEHKLPDGSVESRPGMSRQKMGAVLPGARIGDEVTDDGWWFDHWAGEERALRGMGENADRFLAFLNEHHSPEDLVFAVGHGGSGDALLKRAAGQEVTLATWHELDNASLTQLRWYTTAPGERRFVAEYLNRVDHLPNRLQTANFDNKG
jgi:broad specificity phosphatase PhoE